MGRGLVAVATSKTFMKWRTAAIYEACCKQPCEDAEPPTEASVECGGWMDVS